MAKRLAIVTTHPIQYNAPWFRLLASRGNIDVKVFYTWEQSKQNEKYDPGFGKVISWDIPLLEGYDYTFVKNISTDPGSHHYKGIDNPTLIDEIKDYGADAVLVFGWPFKSHLRCLRYLKGKIPVLFRGDSTLLNETGGYKKLLRRLLLTYIYRNVNYALYVGVNSKAYFKAHGLKEKQLQYAPHAVDNNRFAEPDDTYTEQAAEWREKLGLSHNDFVILFAGKLQSEKDPFFILDLAKQLTDAHYKFLIVGNGPMEQEIKEAAKADSRFIFLDFQNQHKMPVVYRLGDVFLLSSQSETWGLGINEAMACGLPVVVTDRCGGAIDLIQGNGIIVKKGDTKAAAQYIEMIASNEDAYRLAANRSKEIIKNFSFDNIVNNVTTLLNRI